MIDSERESYDTERLTLLADFRDQLRDERDIPENRVHGRDRNGRILVKRDGSVGTGSYTMEYRKMLLGRLKDLQERIGNALITPEEEILIHSIWAEETANLVEMVRSKMGVEATES